MKVIDLRRAIGITVTLFLLVGTGLFGFGHRAQALHGPLDAATIAFLQAGGQLSDICGLDDAGNGTGIECPMCIFIGGFALQDAHPGAPMPSDNHGLALWPVIQTQAAADHFDFSRSTRAPPQA